MSGTVRRRPRYSWTFIAAPAYISSCTFTRKTKRCCPRRALRLSSRVPARCAGKLNNNDESAYNTKKGTTETGRHLLERDLAQLTGLFVKLTSLSDSATVEQDAAQSEGVGNVSSLVSRVVRVASSYSPRSMTGQSVATSFAAARGSVERAVSSARLTLEQTMRALLLTAGTVSASLRSASDSRASEGWALLTSFEWQQVKPAKRSRKHTIPTTADNPSIAQLQKVRASSVQRAVTLRKVSRTSASVAQQLSRATAAVVTASGASRKGGALIALGVGSALTLSTAPGVSAATLALASAAMLGLTDRTRKITDTTITKSDEVSYTDKAAFLTKFRQLSTPFMMQHISRMLARSATLLWMRKNGRAIIVVGVGSALTLSVAPVISAATLVFTSAAVLVATTGVMDKVKVTGTATYPSQEVSHIGQERRKLQSGRAATPTETIERRRGGRSAVEKRKRGGRASRRARKYDDGETIETIAFAVSQPKPSILSVPVLGFLLKLLDGFAFAIENVLVYISKKTLTEIATYPTSVSETIPNDGWELLQSFENIDK